MGEENRLLSRARNGDVEAQQQVWRSHRRWVAAVVLAHRPKFMDVDDLMQEVAVKLVAKFADLRDVAAFRPWLRQIIINVCRGAARSAKPDLRLAHSEAAGDEAQPEFGRVAIPADAHESQAEAVDRGELARRLLEHAMTLPSEYREPLLLRCLQSMSYQQIGLMLNLPVTTIETRLARARRMLRAELGDMLNPDSPA